MAGIELKNVVKRYENGFVAVHGATLEIEDGEFLVLVGPSGCGKSTTLRMIAGLEEVSDGDIFIGDRRVNELEPGHRDIAMVFQNYALYPHMSVRQNMSFGLKMRKEPKDTIAKRVNEAAKILSIESLLDRRPRELSGGQRQRVAVGRAIVRQPAAFLFDEPLSNLDAKLRVQMRTELAKLHQRLKTTTVYVTHDQVEAMTLGDRIVVMKDGLIQQTDSPLNLYHYPVNRFVAGFIGSPAMNFIEGELSGNVFNADGICYSIENQTNQLTEYRGPCSLGFRPEAITLNDSHPVLAEAKVEVVERMGHETIVYCGISDKQVVARLTATANPKPGQMIELRLPANAWYLFSESGDQQILTSGNRSSQPESSQPESSQPESSQPESSQPDLVSPNLVSPNLVSPNLVSPNLVSPNLVSPNPSQPNRGSLAWPEINQVINDYRAHEKKPLPILEAALQL